MRWPAFRKWNEHHTDPVDVGELTSVFGDLRAETSEYTFTTVLESKAFNDAQDRLMFSSATDVVQRSVLVIISGHVGPAPKVHKIST